MLRIKGDVIQEPEKVEEKQWTGSYYQRARGDGNQTIYRGSYVDEKTGKRHYYHGSTNTF